MPAPIAPIPIEDRTYSFALALICAYRKRPPADAADKICWHQLIRSGTSAGANSAEGGGAQSRADWITKRFIALKEMRETLFWLRLIRDSSRVQRDDLLPLIDEARQLVAILTTIVRNARATKTTNRGS